MRVRAKICGITNVDDALSAVHSGCDAIGLVFYEPSPRNIAIKDAIEICQALPAFVTVVGLFVNAQAREIENICREVPLSLLQFHGNESEAECHAHHLPYIKAIRIQTSQDVSDAETNYQTAQAILVDTYKKGIPGGTGEQFDWSLLPEKPKKPLILAGGLTPANVKQAIITVHPYAVDVSGGVESDKGIKNHEKVSLFLKEVSRASENTYN